MALGQIATSFLVGLIATGSPCVFPLYPGFLAYLSADSERIQDRKAGYMLGLLVFLGVVTMILVLGLAISTLSLAIGNVLLFVAPLADLIIITLGILLLLDKNPFTMVPAIAGPRLSNPYASAYVYGLLYGPVALPCAGPLAVTVFALSFSITEFLGKLILFLVFGLGFGLPLLVLSFVARVKQYWLVRQFTAHHRIMNLAAGVVLIGLGLWDFSSNYASLRLFF